MRFLAAAVIALIAGCSDDPPTIRNLLYSPNAGNVGAVVDINGSIDYTDPDDDISQTQLELTDPSGSTTTASPQPIMDVDQGPIGTVDFTIMFTPDQEGNYDFNVWIIDLEGRPSNQLSGVIRVAPM